MLINFDMTGFSLKKERLKDLKALNDLKFYIRIVFNTFEANIKF